MYFFWNFLKILRIIMIQTQSYTNDRNVNDDNFDNEEIADNSEGFYDFNLNNTV